MRWIAVRGLAAVITGTVVLGVGGRLVMLASRLLHPEAVGRATENGNRIGEFTVGGTIGLIVFGGLLSGVFAGVVWAVVREWIPMRSAVVGLGTTAIGGFVLISAENRDFVILGDPRLDLVLLLGLIFGFGAALVPIDNWLEARLPPGSNTAALVTYSLVVALGVPFLIPVFGNFFSEDFCFCNDPPFWTGVFLAMTTLVTLYWWIQHLRGADMPSKQTRTIGSTLVALTVIAGGLYLFGEIVAII
jgi:hypothetical protein